MDRWKEGREKIKEREISLGLVARQLGICYT